jgi:hypothetical protein
VISREITHYQCTKNLSWWTGSLIQLTALTRRSFTVSLAISAAQVFPVYMRVVDCGWPMPARVVWRLAPSLPSKSRVAASAFMADERTDFITEQRVWIAPLCRGSLALG